MKRYKVIYFINYAPNYRDVFLRELGRFVDLTVVSYAGKEANLKDPEKRVGYSFISLKRIRLLNINFNLKEFTLANGDYDVVIVGYTLWNPFRMFNLFRINKRVIAEGLIYGKSNALFTRILRKVYLDAAEGVLVYSKMVKERLRLEISKPIIVFNNTSFSVSDIDPIISNDVKGPLNVLWVGRYQKRKRVERLIQLALVNKNVNVRLIGPGLREMFTNNNLENLEILDEVYSSDLKRHFEWANVVFNPGGAGLLVMNAARFARPIVIDKFGHHGPEVQLAIDAEQDFIDFSSWDEVDKMVEEYSGGEYLKEKGIRMGKEIYNFTVEYMAQQYVKAIKKEWN